MRSSSSSITSSGGSPAVLKEEVSLRIWGRDSFLFSSFAFYRISSLKLTFCVHNNLQNEDGIIRQFQITPLEMPPTRWDKSRRRIRSEAIKRRFYGLPTSELLTTRWLMIHIQQRVYSTHPSKEAINKKVSITPATMNATFSLFDMK